MPGFVRLDISQFFLGLAEMLVGLQIEHNAGALAIRIGKELRFFDSRCFHSENPSRFGTFRNLLLIHCNEEFLLKIHNPIANRCVTANRAARIQNGNTAHADPHLASFSPDDPFALADIARRRTISSLPS
jgi:hypothetical protein